MRDHNKTGLQTVFISIGHVAAQLFDKQVKVRHIQIITIEINTQVDANFFPGTFTYRHIERQIR